jgi:hypothetical protein
VANRLLLTTSLLAFVLVGVVASIALGDWWALGAALAVHAVGTAVVVALTLRLTRETEHVSPTLAARLEEEGVGDPDVFFTELVDEFSGRRPGGRARTRGGPRAPQRQR